MGTYNLLATLREYVEQTNTAGQALFTIVIFILLYLHYIVLHTQPYMRLYSAYTIM